MNLKTWYGNSVRIPGRGNYRFASFAASCVGLVRTVLQRKMDSEVYVRFVDTRTAVANQEERTIDISSKFLDGYFGQEGRGLPQLNSDATLSAILGVIVHEAAHFAYSFPTLENFMEHVKMNTLCQYNEKVAAILGNTIEDIYIEARVCREVSSFEWMLESMNDVMLDEAAYEFAVGKAREVDAVPTDFNQVVACINYMLLAKVYNQADTNEFMDGLFQLALTAKEMDSMEEREELVLTLYNIIMEKMEWEEEGGGRGVDRGVQEVRHRHHC